MDQLKQFLPFHLNGLIHLSRSLTMGKPSRAEAIAPQIEPSYADAYLGYIIRS